MENEATGNDLKKHLRRIYKRENVSEIKQLTLLIFFTACFQGINIIGPSSHTKKRAPKNFHGGESFYWRFVLHEELRNSPDLENYLIIVNQNINCSDINRASTRVRL